jgi:hypothetical protein
VTRFGRAEFVGLENAPEGGIPSYRQQVENGQRKDGRWARLSYFARANYAHNYINWVRKRSNDASWLTRAGRLEHRLVQPWHHPPTPTERAEKFARQDYYVERGAIALGHVAGLHADLFAQPAYYDPYISDFRFEGRPDQTSHPFLYMEAQALFANPHFLAICASREIMAFCREILGPAAALSWAWSWITNPGVTEYQNQNWHRDSSEPLNFVRIFVPLQNIVGLADGPTALIPGTSGIADFRDVRRFSDQEMAGLQAERGAGMIQADAGDAYFVNTMALHRGVTPAKRRGMLSLLVSLSPSHRTPAIIRLRLADLPEHVREIVAANRRFFRFLVA